MSTTTSVDQKPRGPVGRFVENLLIGTVESVARAGAKAFESLAGDASKAVEMQRRKIEQMGESIKSWREMTVGEIDDGDVPEELRSTEGSGR